MYRYCLFRVSLWTLRTVSVISRVKVCPGAEAEVLIWLVFSSHSSFSHSPHLILWVPKGRSLTPKAPSSNKNFGPSKYKADMRHKACIAAPVGDSDEYYTYKHRKRSLWLRTYFVSDCTYCSKSADLQSLFVLYAVISF